MRVAGGQFGTDRQAAALHGPQHILLGLGGAQQLGLRLVVVAGNLGQHAQLGAGQLAVRHGHPQHGRVALHIPAVLKAQRAKLVFRQLPGLPARELVAVLVGAGLNEGTVKFGVLVHVAEVKSQIAMSLTPA